MIRRLCLLAAALAAFGPLCRPASAQAPTSAPAGDRTTLKLADADVTADACQFGFTRAVLQGKVQLKVKLKGDPAQELTLTADKVTVTMAKADRGSDKLKLGALTTAVAEGQVHYDVQRTEAKTGVKQRIEGDCQHMVYDAKAQTLQLDSGDQEAKATLTVTEPAAKPGDEPTVSTMVLTARKSLVVDLSEEPSSEK